MRISDWSSDVCSSDLQNTNAESIFHQRIDTDNIASVGHSQGAGGAINAATQSANLITATAVLDLPDPWWASRPVDVIDVAQLTGPTFFKIGSASWRESVCQAV